MKLEDFRIYQLANDIADIIWIEVGKWDYLSKGYSGEAIN